MTVAAQVAMAQKAMAMKHKASGKTMVNRMMPSHMQNLANAYSQMAQTQGYQGTTNALTTWVSTSATTASTTIGHYIPYTATNQGLAQAALGMGPNPYAGVPAPWRDPRLVDIPDGVERTISLPDGSKIEVAANGSYKILDDGAKVVYRANRVRAFNAFINASDKIEDFIAFCGEHGVRRGEIMDLPIRLFIGWLVLEAAKADGEDEPEEVGVRLLPDLREAAVPRCTRCQRFLSFAKKRVGIDFCGTGCFDRHYVAMVEGTI